MSTDTSNTSKLTVEASEAPTGSMGQKLLISGNAMALRLWNEAPGDGQQKSSKARNYETLGYVLEGKAELTVEDKTITLEPGTSWAVPEGKRAFVQDHRSVSCDRSNPPFSQG